MLFDHGGLITEAFFFKQGPVSTEPGRLRVTCDFSWNAALSSFRPATGGHDEYESSDDEQDDQNKVSHPHVSSVQQTNLTKTTDCYNGTTFIGQSVVKGLARGPQQWELGDLLGLNW